MADFAGQWKFVDAGEFAPQANSELLITLVSSSAANVPGAYSEVITSAENDSYCMLVTSWYSGASNNHQGSMCIGIGPAGSEQCIINGLTYSAKATIATTIPFHRNIPIFIPKGTRIAARTTTDEGSLNSRVGISLLGSSFLGQTFSNATTYGFLSGTTTGTTIDPGATSGTKGAWTQLTSATTDDILFMIANFNIGSNNSIDLLTTNFIDIGYGSAGNETMVAENLFHYSSTTDLSLGGIYSFPCYVPRGSRLVARALSNNTNATDRIVKMTIIGVY